MTASAVLLIKVNVVGLLCDLTNALAMVLTEKAVSAALQVLILQLLYVHGMR